MSPNGFRRRSSSWTDAGSAGISTWDSRPSAASGKPHSSGLVQEFVASWKHLPALEPSALPASVAVSSSLPIVPGLVLKAFGSVCFSPFAGLISRPSVRPSPSVSLFSGLVLPGLPFWLNLLSLNGLRVPLTSSPSLMPSPSVSGLDGSVPIAFSSSLVRPSLSGSALPSYFGRSAGFLWSSEPLVGSVPLLTSSPSLIPPSSVSGSAGLVIRLSPLPGSSSSPSSMPSPSESDFFGLVGSPHGFLSPETSSPSFRPSSSVSGFCGSVPCL